MQGWHTRTMENSREHNASISGRRGAAALVLILLAGLLLRAAFLFSIWHAPDFASPVLDPQLNDYWARAIVTGDWSPPAHADDPEIRTTPYGRPPGYPYFLAVVYRFLGLNYGAPRIVQMALGLANLLLLYLLGKAWFGRGSGLAAAALGAVFWSFIYFEGELNSPVLEVFLYLAMAGALWKWFTSGRWDWALLAGLLLGLHALVRPNVLLPGVFAAGWMVWTAWKSKFALKRGMAHAALFLLAVAAVISPAVVRNYRVAHEFVLISYYGGINAYIGNNPNSTGDSPKIANLRDIAGQAEWNCFNYPQLVRGLAEKQGLPDASFSGASGWFYRHALDFWNSDPMAALSLTARKTALFLGPAEVSDSKVVSIERDHSPLLRWLPGFPAVLALALLWFVLALARQDGSNITGTRGFGKRDSLALFVSLLFMLAGAPVPLMLALMWAIIARAWLRGDAGGCCLGSPFEGGSREAAGDVALGPPSKGDLGGCCLGSPFDASAEAALAKAEGGAALAEPKSEGRRREAAGDVAPGPPSNTGRANVLDPPCEGGAAKQRGVYAVAASLALTLILGHFLSVLPFFIAGRYRLAVAPFLILLGGDVLARLAQWAATPGQRRRAVIGATAGIAFYGAACLPVAAYTPSLSTWHYHRGVALADAGKPGPAAEEFRAALHADQNNAAAWLRLGFACSASGDAPGATDAYTNAVLIAPENALAHNNLGWELQKTGQLNNAQKEYERALALDPRLEIAAVNLSKLLMGEGEHDKAIAVYERLLQKNPKVEQAKKNIEELRGKAPGSEN